MNEPLILDGDPAFSDFRIRALFERVRATAPELEVARVTAVRIYLLELSDEADRNEQIFALLGATGHHAAGPGFFVTPRKGTISPWSSKATDIFHNCGLAGVRRVEHGIYFEVIDAADAVLPLNRLANVIPLFRDRMTEAVYNTVADVFLQLEPAPLAEIDLKSGGRASLEEANQRLGLALSPAEIEYLERAYAESDRNPTDVELVMFGQVNSEHCRHKIFNAAWTIDGDHRDQSLFGMIRHTHACHPDGTLSAYADNAAVIEGFAGAHFEVTANGQHAYAYVPSQIDIVLKVETHNHPTAISPYPGAATGVGGEIRDEGATGIGARSKAGMAAFMVSNLRLPGYRMPWEQDADSFPERLASPLDIMIEGPIGGAAFGNEFGRPQLCGLFRTYEERHAGQVRGYHKPIMAAGGMGNIKREHTAKRAISAGAKIVQLGGPAMRIGLGGGAASSMDTGSNIEELDFDSVQRDNAEMQRRCQEVIDSCTARGAENPILSIHDIGAGGLSNGCPELVAESGAQFWLREIHNEEPSMSPMEIWCCESQERYVLAVAADNVDSLLDICARERCPVAVIGEASGDERLTLYDAHFDNHPIDLDLDVLLGSVPRMSRNVAHRKPSPVALDLGGVTITEAADRVLRLPCVADKTFLITITDRSITGLVARDQMVGPYQVPVADVAITATTYTGYTGEAMALGERTPIALLSGPASGRMAIGEAITNIAAANIGAIGRIKLSANWMCACGEAGEDAILFDTVQAVALELCPTLGISIPVGKDSLSMRTVWPNEQGRSECVAAPLSLLVTSFAPVQDVRKTLTPDLKPGPSELILLDLGRGKNRLGSSSLAQVFNQVGSEAPDVDDPSDLLAFYDAIQALLDQDLLLAYHDRSDGGLLTTLAEMAIAGRVGMDVDLAALGADPLANLFAEELGAVVQVASDKLSAALAVLEQHDAAALGVQLGATTGDRVRIRQGNEVVFERSIPDLVGIWSELTHRMQSHRDNPDCAREEHAQRQAADDPGLSFALSFDPSAAPTILDARPAIAILREQGINGQREMAAAFDRAGFECHDVHMTDLIERNLDLAGFVGLVACGGFSYGDVLGAGSGWAKSILFNDRLKELFQAFFAREETFALGVCNGCQMMSQLREIIPGAGAWPTFARNRSEQFEARFISVEICPSPSILLAGMQGSRLAVPVAHGEGRAVFDGDMPAGHCMRYVDNHGNATERYPANPNGSPDGVTGLTTEDGRVTIMMPHPERVFRNVQLSYRPAELSGDDSPWMRLFRNGRTWVG
jgi:phosphoribosylformylglycinamidine synthase